MWIATEKGFFSIVKDTRTGMMLVRARKKRDLENLFPKKKVHINRNKDYAYRVFATQKEVSNKLFQLGASINYHNFKDHIASKKDQKDKLSSYSQIWSIMNDYQGKFIQGLYNFGKDVWDGNWQSYFNSRYGKMRVNR